MVDSAVFTDPQPSGIYAFTYPPVFLVHLLQIKHAAHQIKASIVFFPTGIVFPSQHNVAHTLSVVNTGQLSELGQRSVLFSIFSSFRLAWCDVQVCVNSPGHCGNIQHFIQCRHLVDRNQPIRTQNTQHALMICSMKFFFQSRKDTKDQTQKIRY